MNRARPVYIGFVGFENPATVSIPVVFFAGGGGVRGNFEKYKCNDR